MKKLILFALIIVPVIAGFAGCIFVNFSESSAVTGIGDPEKFEIKVDGYSGIRTAGFCEIHYYAAPSDTVILEIQPNLREYFIIEVINDDLVVRPTRWINPETTPILTVSTPVLNRLSLDGVGAFTAYDTINTSSFTLKLSGTGKGKAELDVTIFNAELSGAGSFELSGRAETADISMSGAGEINALPLDTSEARIRLSGTGSVKISCSNYLYVKADGMGSVEYIGSPHIDLNTSGLVRVNRLR